MEAQQCAREPTGTNWPTLHETTKTQPKRLLATTIRITLNPHPPTHNTGGVGQHKRVTNLCGGHSSGETPGNIPNPEAKPTNANGTAPDRVWESRTPPQQHYNGEAVKTQKVFHGPTCVCWQSQTVPANCRHNNRQRVRRYKPSVTIDRLLYFIRVECLFYE